MLRALFILLAFCFFFSCTRQETQSTKNYAPFLQVKSEWVDSMLLEMTIEEKLGQLLILQTDLLDSVHAQTVLHAIWKQKIGGLIPYNTSLDDYLDFIDTSRQVARIPLLIGTKQQVVLNNQFTDAVPFPLPATMSAIADDSIHNQLSALYIKQCQMLGINFSLSPAINLNQANKPNYDFNSFENNEKRLIDRSSMMLDKLQEAQILSIGNSFADLVYMDIDTTDYVDSVLYRYTQLTKKGLSGLLTGNEIYQIDTIERLQSSFLTNYYKEQLNFNGLVVSELDKDGTIDELIHAGTDLFVINKNVNQIHTYLTQFVREGLMSEKVLNEKVRKVLMAKAWTGLDTIPPQLDRDLAKASLNYEKNDFYVRQMYESSVIVAHNHQDLLPYQNLEKRKFNIVQIGNRQLKTFKNTFSNYANFSSYLHKKTTTGGLKILNPAVFKHRNMVLTLDSIRLDTTIHQAFIESVNALSKQTKITVVNFGTPYNLIHFDTSVTSIQVYEHNKITASYAAQLLFGGAEAKGKLPVHLTNHMPYGHGEEISVIRLGYTIPEELGIAAHKLVGIEAIIRNAIFAGATPGCQILLAKKGKVFFNKSYGHHSYDRNQAVKKKDLYDLASLTKITATTLASMKLYEDQKFKMKDRLRTHVDCGEKSKLKNILIKDLFTHRSRLQANMPIVNYLLNKDTIIDGCNRYFCNTMQGDHVIKIADSMYMDFHYIDSIWLEIYDLKLRRRKKHLYSDVNFNLIQQLIERKAKKDMDDYLYQEFYNPLNLKHCLFNPLTEYEPTDIVPTQHDEKWRKQLLRGYVHDESAALLGGVGGNAGLFGNTQDLAIICQLLLNGGNYGGQEFLKPETIDYFTSVQKGTTRGLGFDVKTAKGTRSCSKKASNQTYGHTGFTGTCIWIDPKEELIFIFLANRIHPDVNNKSLYRNEIRRRIHTVVYDALDTYDNGVEELEEPEKRQAKLAM